MQYKGTARIELDPDDELLVGHLAGIDDLVGFHATSVDELRAAFRESVDDHLATCEKLGKHPERP